MRFADGIDAGTVAAAQDRVLLLLDMAEVSGTKMSLEPYTDGGVARLRSSQHLSRAARGFPAGRLDFGRHAAAALSALEQPKEI
ncbi:hypothetical protein [Palleronia aestuarii]|nr:hypothetical protein [Palleronia aestuarii]